MKRKTIILNGYVRPFFGSGDCFKSFKKAVIRVADKVKFDDTSAMIADYGQFFKLKFSASAFRAL